jgi:thiol-disulfide isomerase/thioredoxin
MNLFAKFEAALPLTAFLTKYGTDAHRARWQAALAQTVLSDDQKKIAGAFTRRVNVLVLAGAWCGDCSSQCPIFERIAEVSPNVVVRYLDRDEHADAQAALQINGGNRVPVAVLFSEDGHEVARYGERTLARYRQLVAQLTGEGCATGFVKSDDPIQKEVVREWFEQVERVHHILRLSPRLRARHGD